MHIRWENRAKIDKHLCLKLERCEHNLYPKTPKKVELAFAGSTFYFSAVFLIKLTYYAVTYT
jgi:hypothetical protein